MSIVVGQEYALLIPIFSPVSSASVVRVISYPSTHLSLIDQRTTNNTATMVDEIQDRTPGSCGSHPALMLLSRITSGRRDPLSLEA